MGSIWQALEPLGGVHNPRTKHQLVFQVCITTEAIIEILWERSKLKKCSPLRVKLTGPGAAFTSLL